MAYLARKDPAKVLDKMRTLCSRREYCCSDIMKKTIAALDGDRGKAVEIIDTLVKEKYLDDSRYAAAFARDKSSIAGWGPVKIRYMLSAKGISDEHIKAALSEVDDDRASSRFQKLMENKARSLKNDPQRSLKLKRFALSRGYDYDEAARIIDKILCTENLQ